MIAACFLRERLKHVIKWTGEGGRHKLGIKENGTRKEQHLRGVSTGRNMRGKGGVGKEEKGD